MNSTRMRKRHPSASWHEPHAPKPANGLYPFRFPGRLAAFPPELLELLSLSRLDDEHLMEPKHEVHEPSHQNNHNPDSSQEDQHSGPRYGEQDGKHCGALQLAR